MRLGYGSTEEKSKLAPLSALAPLFAFELIAGARFGRQPASELAGRNGK
jgi:hypothetical protein